MMTMVPVLRPDGTLFWLPPGMAMNLGLRAVDRVPADVWNGAEIQQLLASRIAANDAKPPAHCNEEWHVENGYL